MNPFAAGCLGTARSAMCPRAAFTSGDARPHLGPERSAAQRQRHASVAPPSRRALLAALPATPPASGLLAHVPAHPQGQRAEAPRRLAFGTDPPVLGVVAVPVALQAGQGHCRVPLLASPFGYTTYRGS